MSSNPYTQSYTPRGSRMGVDMGGSLAAALNELKGVDGLTYYASDIRQMLVYDGTTFGAWAPVEGKSIIQAPIAWVTSTTYAAGTSVTINGLTYVCLIAHTSGTFATDLAAGDWALTNYPRYLYDDFRAGTLDTRYAGSNGGGAAAASPALVSGSALGEINLVTGTANGATACSALTLALAWTPNFTPPWQAAGAPASAGASTVKQKLTLQGKLKTSSISSASFFIGFSDVLATSAGTSQTPLTLGSSTLAISGTNTAIANAVGFLLDTTQNGHLWIVSANAATPTTPVDASTISGAPAIAAAVYLYWKITVDTSGNATFYLAPVPTTPGGSPQWVTIGTIAAAVAANAKLTPAAYVASRSGTSVTLTLDAWTAS